MTTLCDPTIISRVYEMKDKGVFISDIAKILSNEVGDKITQISICRALNAREEEPQQELTELDYPSRMEMEEVFSELLQKQENRICIFGGKQLKRNVMIEILNKFMNKEFDFQEVKKNLYKTTDGDTVWQHWNYLLKGNYIEKVDDYKFKFCDRVKKWKTFGQV